MKKVLFENTYGYDNFISEKERVELENWALDIKDNMLLAIPMNNEKDQYAKNLVRHFSKLSELTDIPNIVNILKSKIIKLESLENALPEIINGDWIGIVGEGGYVEPHMDANLNSDYYTRRYNLLISVPIKGGNPIYDGVMIPIQEKLLWRCDAGLFNHTSEKVIGNKFRITLSFGFSIPTNLKNHKKTLL